MNGACLPCLGATDEERRLGMYADVAGVALAFAVVGILGYFVMRSG